MPFLQKISRYSGSAGAAEKPAEDNAAKDETVVDADYTMVDEDNKN